MHDPQLCTLRDLRDGTYSLGDLRDMHEAMDQDLEYAERWRVVLEQREKAKTRR